MATSTLVVLRDLLGVTADQTSPASNTHQETTACGGFASYKAITFLADLQGATGGTLDVVIEHSPDGTNWYEYVHFTQLGAGAAAVSYSYSPMLNDLIVQVGKNKTTTTTLNANSAAGGHWFDQLRVRYVAGSGTSAGATQAVKVLCVRDSGQ